MHVCTYVRTYVFKRKLNKELDKFGAYVCMYVRKYVRMYSSVNLLRDSTGWVRMYVYVCVHVLPVCACMRSRGHIYVHVCAI